jgi:hypothetical protein
MNPVNVEGNMKSGVLGIAAIALTAVGLLIAVAFLLVAPVNATELEFDGQVRVRLEGFDRGAIQGGNPGHTEISSNLGTGVDAKLYLRVATR